MSSNGENLKAETNNLNLRRFSKDFNQLTPVTFIVETVLGCDLKCPECAVGGNRITKKKGWMRFEQFKIIADKIRPFCTLLFLHHNGEPMLNRDIYKMLEYASSFTDTNISTNGQSLTEETAEKLVKSGVTDIIVSIDGFSQKVYEQYRVGGSAGKALWALKMAVSLIMSPITVLLVPAAQIMISGSDDRSICFLSSTKSDEIVL